MLLLLPLVAGWGRDGHAIIADLAQGLLSDTARAAALGLLGGANLSDVPPCCIQPPPES